MSRIRRRLKPSVNADMVPMIDVVFQLVIFFMISISFTDARFGRPPNLTVLMKRIVHSQNF